MRRLRPHCIRSQRYHSLHLPRDPSFLDNFDHQRGDPLVVILRRHNAKAALTRKNLE